MSEQTMTKWHKDAIKSIIETLHKHCPNDVTDEELALVHRDITRHFMFVMLISGMADKADLVSLMEHTFDLHNEFLTSKGPAK